MADWFSQLANQALKIADDFTDSLVAQANEAQEQIKREQEKLRAEEENKQQLLASGIQLPWETEDESLQILSESLMDSILKLSLNEKNFTEKSPNSEDVHFVFSDFVATAMRLLQLDANLANIHSRISPRMDEEIFWRNYYCRVIYLRAMCGIDGLAAQEQMKTKWGNTDLIIIHEVDVQSESLKSRYTGDRSGTSSRNPSAATGRDGGKCCEAVDDDHELLAELGLDDVEDTLDEEVHFKPATREVARSGPSERVERQDGEEDQDKADQEVEEDDEPLDLGDLDDMDLLNELDICSEDGAGGKQVDGVSCVKDKDSGGELGSYEEVGKSDCHSSNSNAELEAQIAAELANLSDDDC